MSLIVYVDTSAILKQYINEIYSRETIDYLRKADFLGSSLLIKVEFTSGLVKASRMKWVSPDVVIPVLKQFNIEIAHLHLINVDQTIVNRAAELALQFGLRGYDAVHLASALIWQEDLAESVTMTTFDRPLQEAAKMAGLAIWLPEG